MHDATTLYFGAVIADATIDSNDQFDVGFDVDGNGGDPETRDRKLSVKRSGTSEASTKGGDGNSFGVSGLANPHTAARAERVDGTAWNAEFSVPRTAVGAVGGAVRLYVQGTRAGNDLESPCPPGASETDLDSWMSAPLL
jgi:hypothetical protein